MAGRSALFAASSLQPPLLQPHSRSDRADCVEKHRLSGGWDAKSILPTGWEDGGDDGPRQVAQGSLFYEFSLEDHAPDPLLRSIDRFVDLRDMRRHLAPFYSSTGRPSVDPELMIGC